MVENNGTQRIVTLDAMRGFAVMGILAMNIIGFAMPQSAYVSPYPFGGDTSADIIAWALSFLLIDGKMRGLFSILFGASLLLITDRAEAKGQSAASVHLRRMGWLAIFGLCHFYFIWWGDILFLYAVVGVAAFLMRRWSPARLIRWAIGLYATGTLALALLMGSDFVEVLAGESAAASASQAEIARELRADYEITDADIDEEIALYRSDYATIVATQMEDWPAPFVAVAWSFLEILPLMMLGMALFRNGFLTGGWSASAYRRTAAVFMVPGTLLTLLLIWVQWHSGFDVMVTTNAFVVWGLPARLMMTVGYAALLLLLIRRLAGSGLLERVTAAGRVAFTNYLGTSIVMTFIFYGYGLGLFAAVPRAPLYLFVVGAWVVMLGWSKPWLDRFAYGPFEWLWRSLARGQIEPLRRRQ